jgi:hypothetical protein
MDYNMDRKMASRSFLLLEPLQVKTVEDLAAGIPYKDGVE